VEKSVTGKIERSGKYEMIQNAAKSYEIEQNDEK